MTERERTALRDAFLAGYAAAVKNLAVWRDGQQFVGVMQKPLHVVLGGLREDKFVISDCLIYLTKVEDRARKARERCHDHMEPCPDCGNSSRA